MDVLAIDNLHLNYVPPSDWVMLKKVGNELEIFEVITEEILPQKP